MKKLIIGLILGAILNGMYVTYRITGGVWNNKTIAGEVKKAELEQYNNGFNTGYSRGDFDGFQRCYNNRDHFPFYTPEESKNF